MMVGVASQVEMRAHHIQIWPPSCRSTPLERPDMCANSSLMLCLNIHDFEINAFRDGEIMITAYLISSHSH